MSGIVVGALTGIEQIRVGGLVLAFDAVTVIDAHRQGTATFTTGSPNVTGVGTGWSSDLAGRRIKLNADDVEHVILSVGGATSLTLTANYSSAGGSGAYTILPTRVAEHVPLGVEEQAIEIDFCYVKAVYDAVGDAVLAQTSDTWTLTDSGGNTHSGLGRLASCSDKKLSSDGHAMFTATLIPTTQWTYTAA